MSAYAASNLLGGTQQAMTTTFKTLMALSASSTTALRRQRVIEFIFGTDGTAADNAMVCDVSRVTAIGTATQVTPNPIDAADTAMLGQVNVNHTVEPTVTPNSRLEGWAFNQRATQRWVAYPGKELILPAVNNNGLAFRMRSPQGYTGTGVCDAISEEL